MANGVTIHTKIVAGGTIRSDGVEVPVVKSSVKKQVIVKSTVASTGPQGASGVTGPIGATGPSGPQGACGVSGVSGVIGPTGITGPTGPQGACGVSGVSGVTGVPGTNGACGVSGVTGVPGTNGACGVSGVIGATGPVGACGVSGVAGACGVSGVAGACGVSGVAGACGVSGVAGACGVSGVSGVTGVPGTNGACGVSGVSGVSGIAGPSGPVGNQVYKESVELATVAALPTNIYSNGSSGVGATLTGTAFGALTIDGVTVVLGDRVLIKNEADQTHNGVYDVTTVGAVAALYVLTRSTDFDQTIDIEDGSTVFVLAGNTLAFSVWVQTTRGTITVGSSNLVFGQGAGAGACGVSGVSGVPGACGVSGVSGVTGVPGTNGACGVSGISGVTGVPGTNGACGVSGVSGVIGATGPALTGSILAYGGRTAPAGYLNCDGSAVSRSTYAALFAVVAPTKSSFTVTIAAPAVVTNTAHGLSTGDQVYLTTSGALPTGLTANTLYYAIRVDANTFNLATSRANAYAATKITTTGSQSGTHTLWDCPYGLGDGSTTFTLPDLRGRVPAGMDTTAGTAASRLTLAQAQGVYGNIGATGGEQGHVLLVAELAAHRHTIFNTDTSGFSAISSANQAGMNRTTGSDFSYAFDNSGSATDATVGRTSSIGSDTAHNTIGPTQLVNFIIAT